MVLNENERRFLKKTKFSLNILVKLRFYIYSNLTFINSIQLYKLIFISNLKNKFKNVFKLKV